MQRRLIVLYGGKSGEHDISIRSASSIISALKDSEYEVIPLYITIDGCWQIGKSPELAPKLDANLYLGDDNLRNMNEQSLLNMTKINPVTDIVFPVMHGSGGEDGSIQGLFEVLNIPYVGSGVLSSAVTLDKEFTKRLALAHNIRVAPFLAIRKASFMVDKEKFITEIKDNLKLPLFIKPANTGSSIGVSKVAVYHDLEKAIMEALIYDNKIIVERAIDARELEISVLENIESHLPPKVSEPGEIIVGDHDYYSFEAKYNANSTVKFDVPAALEAKVVSQMKEVAAKLFIELECNSLARVDFLLERKTGELYLNEINSMPGFTDISLYPKMWECSGISYKQLIEELIDLALARHDKKTKAIRYVEV